jgi:hypothetical protein
MGQVVVNLQYKDAAGMAQSIVHPLIGPEVKV